MSPHYVLVLLIFFSAIVLAVAALLSILYIRTHENPPPKKTTAKPPSIKLSEDFDYETIERIIRESQEKSARVPQARLAHGGRSARRNDGNDVVSPVLYVMAASDSGSISSSDSCSGSSSSSSSSDSSCD